MSRLAVLAAVHLLSGSRRDLLDVGVVDHNGILILNQDVLI